MNPPPTTLLSNKWDMGPIHNSNTQRISDGKIDGLMKGCQEKDMVMSFMVSQRSYVDLLQNCDLPPPAKVFPGESEIAVRLAPSMQQPSPSIKVSEMEDEFAQGLSNDKLGLLRALQLSQTRAREAEKKAADISAEKDRLTALFLEESSRLFAHRQWLKLLEIEVKKLHPQLTASHGICRERWSAVKKDDGEEAGTTWCIALALCLGIASVGFALSYRYLF
ncbi:uncharacterized protein LOC131242368 isoform X1 [Magnolia sinica]|uniref:uncharacterized protein LOC131242368 isoform X1 n=1 Tax=Magnolia sinica TaxID=86752 RepID=UPI00265B18AA|nr:uncharacterized protein LOC131242368 isoform X1 [Magnolia sinica]